MKKKNHDDLFSYDYSLEHSVVYLGSFGQSESGVDHRLAESAIKTLFVLDKSKTAPINIFLNNVGGDWYHGMAVYDAIRSCSNEVIITVYGQAMSMGSIILQAADQRIMMPNSTMMIHHGTDWIGGHSEEVQTQAKHCREITKAMIDIYCSRSGLNKQKVKDLLKFGSWISAKESVKLGLADNIFQGGKFNEKEV